VTAKSFTLLTWLYYDRCSVHGRPRFLLASLDPFGGIELWKIVKFEKGVIVERKTTGR